MLLAAAASPLRAEWNPALAARYLDARQQEWFAWKTAQSADGPCVSCHTGMTYLLARPVLRRALHEAAPTAFETGLLNRLRTKMAKPAEGALGTVEAVFGAMFLSRDDARATMSSHGKQAFDRLWELQETDGPGKGGWQWYEANLDPWENPESGYYGAALVALALGQAPEAYRQDPASRSHRHVTDGVSRESAGAAAAPRSARHCCGRRRPRSRCSTRTRAAPWWPRPSRGSSPTAGGRSSRSGRGWRIRTHRPSAGSHAYATAYTAFVLQRAGVPASHPGLAKALDWLRAHQDPATGAWPAVSMNKRYPDGSMPSLFMQDAATAFAAMALVDGDPAPRR